MSATTTHSTANDPARLQKVEELLSRYPNVDGGEKREILDFLRTGPMLDRALITGVEGVKAQLEQFRADHEKEFGTRTLEIVVIAAIILMVVLLGFFLWDAGSSG